MLMALDERLLASSCNREDVLPMAVLVWGYFPQNSQPITVSVLFPLVMLMNNREKNCPANHTNKKGSH